MSKEKILNYFYTNNTNLDVLSILFVLVGGLIIGGIIYVTYKITHNDVTYNEKYNYSLILTLLISIVVMQMISSNIVISLGMVGALSIVRFRTAIKDSRDTVFMFWSITEGLAIGSGNFKLAITTTVFIAITTIIFTLIKHNVNKYLLIVTGKEKELDIDNVLKKLKDFTIGTKIRNVAKSTNSQEIIIELKTKGELKLELLDIISNIDGINSVNYINESEENVG